MKTEEMTPFSVGQTHSAVISHLSGIIMICWIFPVNISQTINKGEKVKYSCKYDQPRVNYFCIS